MSSSIIQISDMNKWYGKFHVLRDINLDVREQERIVICGPSGSGKSTLIRCINRLEEHQQGDIIVDGITLTDNLGDIESIRREVGMVFSILICSPLTVLENCTLAPMWVRIPRKEAEDTAMQYLERVKIPEQAENILASYQVGSSSGWRSRVFRMKPKIMLFDEPTSALDPEMIKEVLDTMVDLAEEGMTMICVTHEMGFCAALRTGVIFMADGQIIEQNKPEPFFENPQHDRTKEFLSQIIH